MVLQLHGSPVSTCVQRVKALLYELDVPFEMVIVDFSTGEHKSPAFKKNQPFGKVPYLNDDGLILFESRSLLRYLAKKYEDKKNLIGEDVKEKALIDNWLEAEAQNYNPPVSALAFEKVFKVRYGGATDEEVVKAETAKLDAVLDAYEAVLSDGRLYIAGDRYSIADIAHLSYGHLVFNKLGITEPLEKHPLVKAWWERITSTPSWKKVVAE